MVWLCRLQGRLREADQVLDEFDAFPRGPGSVVAAAKVVLDRGELQRERGDVAAAARTILAAQEDVIHLGLISDWRGYITGHLGADWAEWFGGLTLTLDENGETLITGPSFDQAALHGLLKKVRDLGLTLVSVNPVEPNSGGKK